MNINNYNKEIKFPKLRADLIELILIYCIKGELNLNLLYRNQKILPIKQNIIKRYLFFLIEFGLISYNGQKQIFTIKEKGLDLLNIIEDEKTNKKTDMQNTIITF